MGEDREGSRVETSLLVWWLADRIDKLEAWAKQEVVMRGDGAHTAYTLVLYRMTA